MIAADALPGAALADLLERERGRVDEELAGIAVEAGGVVPAVLLDAVRYALSTHGKRLRPILCVVAYRTVGGAAHEASLYSLASALEIVHTYSLVHDDLPCMDDDDLRRGRPTVHRIYGSAKATLAGAALLPLAVRVMDRGARGLGLTTAVRGIVIAELCRAAGAAGMVGGQLRDLEGESTVVDGDALESIHRAKTGALLTASLRVGAIAGGATPRELAALTAYGEALGLAFQITDDVLDVVGSEELLGKTAGRDQYLRKASYPALFGLDGARALARTRAEEARAALAGLRSPALAAMAGYVVERER